MNGDQDDGDGGEPPADWPGAGMRSRAAAFLDLWERQVSEHARRGPSGDALAPGEGSAGRAETP